jgi:hypothetical protein
MANDSHHWRIIPSPFVANHVERWAAEEVRSRSNMLHKLLTEAVNARIYAKQEPERERVSA